MSAGTFGKLPAATFGKLSAATFGKLSAATFWVSAAQNLIYRLKMQNGILTKRMESIKISISRNEKRNQEPPKRVLTDIEKKENRKWNALVKEVKPSKIQTVWLMMEDPLMGIAGEGYKSVEVREKTFALQQEASTSKIKMKGNKYTKAKVAEALGAMTPTKDQTKTLAGILYFLREIQTIWYNEEEKTIWTMPEDLRQWNPMKQVLWMNGKIEETLEFDNDTKAGKWILDREKEGWVIEMPVTEGTFEEIKRILSTEFPEIQVHPSEGEKKAKKEDYAKALGRAQAIQALMKDSI